MTTEFPEAFDPAAQKGSEWSPILPGEYTAQIIEAKVAPPSTGDGYMLTLVWKITEGDHENRQVWQNIAFLHSSTQAVEIGRRMLTDLVQCGRHPRIHLRRKGVLVQGGAYSAQDPEEHGRILRRSEPCDADHAAGSFWRNCEAETGQRCIGEADQ